MDRIRNVWIIPLIVSLVANLATPFLTGLFSGPSATLWTWAYLGGWIVLAASVVIIVIQSFSGRWPFTAQTVEPAAKKSNSSEEPNLVLPLARTPASRKWLYTPLENVYRRNYRNEEVMLDGHNFIDCEFDEGVTFVYNGTAPFKMLNPKPTAKFVMKIKTDNLIVQHLMSFLRETNIIGGEIEHQPPVK